MKTLPSALPSFTETNPAEWVLSFDFDGTLVAHDETPMVQAGFFQLMESMRESHRALWGLNTGRSLAHALEGMLESRFLLLPDFIIAREREIYLRNEFGRWVGINDWNKACDKDHRKLFRKNKRLLKRLRKWVEKNTQAAWGSQEDEPAGIVATTLEEMALILAEIDKEIASTPELSYQRNSVYLRFSHRDYHKGSAIAEYARQQGLGADRVFAMGDGHNDLDMLDVELAKYIACPDNSEEDIKKHVLDQGGFVSSSRASQGVIDALQKLLHDKGDLIT